MGAFSFAVNPASDADLTQANVLHGAPDDDLALVSSCSPGRRGVRRSVGSIREQRVGRRRRIELVHFDGRLSMREQNEENRRIELIRSEFEVDRLVEVRIL